MSSFPELDALLAEYESVSGGSEGSHESVAFLARVKEHSGSDYSDRSGYLALRGRARLHALREINDAFEDLSRAYWAAIDEGEQSTLINLHLVHHLLRFGEHDKAATWLTEAESRMGPDPPTGWRGLVGDYRGQFFRAIGDPRAQAAFSSAALDLYRTDLADRWLGSRFGEIDCSMDLESATGPIDWRLLLTEAGAIGLARIQAVPAAVSLALKAQDEEGVVEFLCGISAEEMAEVDSLLRPRVATVLRGAGRDDDARRVLRQAMMDAEVHALWRWWAGRDLLAWGLESGSHTEDEFLAHVRARPRDMMVDILLIGAAVTLEGIGRQAEAQELYDDVEDKSALADHQREHLRLASEINFGRGQLDAARRTRSAVATIAPTETEVTPEWLLQGAQLALAVGATEGLGDRLRTLVEEAQSSGDVEMLTRVLNTALALPRASLPADIRHAYFVQLLELRHLISGDGLWGVSLSLGQCFLEIGAFTAAEQCFLEAIVAGASYPEEDTAPALWGLARAVAGRDPSNADRDFAAVVSGSGRNHQIRGLAWADRGAHARTRGDRRARGFLLRAAEAFEGGGMPLLAAESLAEAAACPGAADVGLACSRRAFGLALAVVGLVEDATVRERTLTIFRRFGLDLMRRLLSVGRHGSALEAAVRIKAGGFARLDGEAIDIDAPTLAALHAAVRPELEPAANGPFATQRNPAAAGLRIGRLPPPRELLRADPILPDACTTATAIQRRLRDKEAAVEYIIDVEGALLTAFIIRRRDIRVVTRKWQRVHAEAAELIGDVVSGERLGGDEWWLRTRLQALSTVLIGPLGRLPEQVERLWIAAGGLLAEVPFGALAARDGTALIDRLDIRMLTTSGQLATLPRRRRLPRRAIVLRGGDDPNSRLVGADLERTAVLETLRSSGLEIVSPSADGFAAADIIHYVGHARFDRRAGSGGLSLPGLTLTDEAFAGLRLRSRPLVVISGCESGRTAEGLDGFGGFLRAAFAAGARDVVCSGWSADDVATAEMMEKFYRHLARGMSPAPALRAAARGLRASSPERLHPFFWANFRCYGGG